MATREILFDDTYTGARWRYGLPYRPITAYSAFGAAGDWIVFSHRPSADRRFPFGTVDYPRELPADVADQLGLVLLCERCGERKGTEQVCPGNDECIYGPDGGAAYACEGWSRMCCKCGASYALGQI